MRTDRIQKDIVINATRERVWGTLVTFFWVDDGGLGTIDPKAGDRFVAHSAKEGDFPILIEKADRPRLLSYRWASAQEGAQPSEGNSTLVEFTLTEQQDGTTLLGVVESGFASLPPAMATRAVADNTYGWEQQLGVLKKSVEG
ncbi:SRPBCC domain-containing protein [Saccharomonospora sp. NPDC006951]